MNGAALAPHADNVGDVLPLTAVYLTAAQLADLVQVDSATVYRWAKEEASMPVMRLRGVVRFPRERVLRWLAEHEQGQAQSRRRAASGSAAA